jgi:hypothetical protein
MSADSIGSVEAVSGETLSVYVRNYSPEIDVSEDGVERTTYRLDPYGSKRLAMLLDAAATLLGK